MNEYEFSLRVAPLGGGKGRGGGGYGVEMNLGELVWSAILIARNIGQGQVVLEYLMRLYRSCH